MNAERLAELAEESAATAKEVDVLKERRKDLNTKVRDAEGAHNAVQAKIRAMEEEVPVRAEFVVEGSNLVIYEVDDDGNRLDQEPLETRAATQKELEGRFEFDEKTMTQLLLERIERGEQPSPEDAPMMNRVTALLITTGDEKIEDVLQRLGDEVDAEILRICAGYDQKVLGGRAKVQARIKERLKELLQ